MKIEYRISGNRLGMSVKYPPGIQEKWSEKDILIRCCSCGSDSISSNKDVDSLYVICNSCPNYWYGYIDRVLNTYTTGEPMITPPPRFEEK